MQALLVFCTCPTREVAETLARLLVEERLAACVNLLPQVQSVYRWQGRLATDDEVLLLIKTQAARLEALQQRVLENHPYELPEVIAVEIGSGLPRYLDWIDEHTRPGPPDHATMTP